MKVSVTYALPEQQSWIELDLPDHATVQDAIEASGIPRAYPTLDLSQQKVGIFGKLVSLQARLEAGQRVEIYRPITADPKLLLPDGGEEDT